MNGEKISSDAFVCVSGKLGMRVDRVMQEKLNCKRPGIRVYVVNFMNTSVHYQSDQKLRMIVYIITEICAKLYNLLNSERVCHDLDAKSYLQIKIKSFSEGINFVPEGHLNFFLLLLLFC